MGPGGSVVGLTFDATVAWPAYDWMGVAKAGLESTSRYLARDLGPDGIRVNLVVRRSAATLAAKAIPGFERPRGHVERPARRWAGTTPTTSRPRKAVVRAALGLLPGDHRRDRPRRRRLPRHGRLSAASTAVRPRR